MLLADQKPSHSNAYGVEDNAGAYLRMARLYYDRYSWILDWSNVHGKTALHIAALKGNEELVRVRLYTPILGLESPLIFNQMLCHLGADFDLSDNKGNTPLH
jgi:ankyrin repeat protein